jgi:hypothetical protein
VVSKLEDPGPHNDSTWRHQTKHHGLRTPAGKQPAELHKAMEYSVDGKPHVRVTLGSDNITVSGNVNLLDAVRINNTEAQRIPVYLVGNVLAVTGNVGVSGNVNVNNFPTSFNIGTMPEVEIKNDTGNPIPVTGNVTATITDVITVIAEEDPGELYAFNNHATNTNRGWTMDEVMRPVVSFQNGSANAADIIKILEYEIGNNNANQSTIVYEWYEGPLTISGAAIPEWTTFGVHSQYRVYQDRYQSNTGNTFTVPAGTYHATQWYHYR